MKVIPPLTITNAMLTSSTATEPGPGETAWVSAGTYSTGDVRIRTSTHRKYRCLNNHTGVTIAPESDATNWLDIGPTNKWAMFDLERNTGTVVSGGTLEVVIQPGRRVSSIGLVGLVADELTIEVTSGGGPVLYSVTESLRLRNTTKWSEYYFGEFRFRTAVVRFDLPLVANAEITITLTKASGDITCGGIVLGTAVDLGRIVTNSAPTSDTLNFSKVDRDDFGNATLVKRRAVPKTRQQLLAPKNSVDKLREVRDDLDAVPALWSGLDDKSASGYFETLLILGIYKEFSISLDHENYAVVNLQLEEI